MELRLTAPLASLQCPWLSAPGSAGLLGQGFMNCDAIVTQPEHLNDTVDIHATWISMLHAIWISMLHAIWARWCPCYNLSSLEERSSYMVTNESSSPGEEMEAVSPGSRSPAQELGTAIYRG